MAKIKHTQTPEEMLRDQQAAIKYHTLESIPNISQLQNYTGNNLNEALMSIGIPFSQVDLGAIAKQLGIADSYNPGTGSFGAMGDQQFLSQLKGTAHSVGTQEGITNQAKYGQTGQIPSNNQLGTANPIANQIGAISSNVIPPNGPTGIMNPNDPNNPGKQPAPPNPVPPLTDQIGALNGVGNSTSGNQNGVGNSNTGTQYTPGQTGAALGNISEQMTPQDQQRKAIGTDPNNITGYQNLNPL